MISPLLLLLHRRPRYDILSLDEADSDREDLEGVDWAVDYLHRYLYTTVLSDTWSPAWWTARPSRAWLQTE